MDTFCITLQKFQRKTSGAEGRVSLGIEIIFSTGYVIGMNRTYSP
jgi:hypothetical protein